MPDVVAPRRRDARANRQKLTDAAASVFAEDGLSAPLEGIAQRAGLSIGTLYNHFPSREELFDAVYPPRLAALAEHGRAALAEPDPWTGFTGFLVGVFELQARDRGLNEAMTMRFPAAPALTEACEQGFGALAELLGQGQRAGAIRADLAMSDLACLVWSVSRVVAATVDVAPQAWRRCLDLQLDGLRATAAHPSAVLPMTTEQVAAAMRR